MRASHLRLYEGATKFVSQAPRCTSHHTNLQSEINAVLKDGIMTILTLPCRESDGNVLGAGVETLLELKNIERRIGLEWILQARRNSD